MKRFGNGVSLGSKAVWIKPDLGRRNTDALVCVATACSS
jgi:hypothetical protein